METSIVLVLSKFVVSKLECNKTSLPVRSTILKVIFEYILEKSPFIFKKSFTGFGYTLNSASELKSETDRLTPSKIS